ncbi:class I SAM-dependent methyltransferase [Leptospira kemamanensis]|uniref:Class I SAM-dependent methyltransferase n=1 Tax=Leptospira kemamanensis TaxID=2484942 RepID=A0A4R9JRY1_9LEPT|nr:class I SAM-dependent methyltransferase [Leptospira kemamanensis]TGL51532.1 class I SAM-dependent methyltransferase [Leptospira kemamanensis]
MEPKIFDQIAKQYDTEDRVQLAHRILEKLKPFLNDTETSCLLDFGCGTGLLGIPLTSQYKEVLFCDDSNVMLDVVLSKIKAENLSNAKTISLADWIESPTILADQILLSLVLLHIPDTDSILKTLSNHLKPNGKIFIVDFVKNEKVSHPKVHNGFLTEELEQKFKSIGFRTVTSLVILEEKKVFMNEDASLFLLIAEK